MKFNIQTLYAIFRKSTCEQVGLFKTYGDAIEYINDNGIVGKVFIKRQERVIVND